MGSDTSRAPPRILMKKVSRPRHGLHRGSAACRDPGGAFRTTSLGGSSVVTGAAEGRLLNCMPNCWVPQGAHTPSLVGLRPVGALAPAPARGGAPTARGSRLRFFPP